MGKPFGSRFRQMVRKMQDWWISYWNHAYHLNKSCSPFTTKRLRNFHEFPWGTFCSEMYLLVGYRLEFPKKNSLFFFEIDESMAARWSHCYFWIVPTLSDFYEKFSGVFEILGSFHVMNHWQRSQRSRNRHLLRLQELNFGLELVFSCLESKKSGKEIASPNFQ